MQHLCQVFGVHRSSYRAWRGRDRRPCETEQKLLDQVVEAHTVSNGSAGARSIAKMFTQAVTQLSRYRASKRMKQLGLMSSQPPSHAYKKARCMVPGSNGQDVGRIALGHPANVRG
ncbi:IS3 family transposase [Cobetia sp. SIMBA_158]|uniref:IS3 family transposase n=1 Tax=Cobetia sp. SIMBA_158 TaxID=3081617 RepID=UPI00397F8084